MKLKTKFLIGFFLISAAIISAGIIAINEIKMLSSTSEEINLKNAPLINAAMQIELSATQARLGIEEIIHDITEKEALENAEDVFELFKTASWYADAILKGGKNVQGTFYPVNEPAIEDRILSLKTEIEACRKLSQVRLENLSNISLEELFQKNEKSELRDEDEKRELRNEEDAKRLEFDDKAFHEEFDDAFAKLIQSAIEVKHMLQAKIMQENQKMLQERAERSTLKLGFGALFTFIIVLIGLYYIARDIIKTVGGEPAEIAKITEQVAAGNLDIQFHESDKRAASGIYAAIQVMVKKLKTINNETEHHNWLKTGQAHLNDQMSGELDIVILAKNIISFLTKYIEAQVGLFYLIKESNKKPYLQMIASYGYKASKDRPEQFEIGEGLLGQAVLEQKMFSRALTPEEYTYIIQSGLATVMPHHVLIIPFLYENSVKGVIEIGCSKKPTRFQLDFLEHVILNIGVAVNTAESRTQRQVLLDQTQKQAKELQIQKKEVQVLLEQSQNQAKELQAQKKELQLKQEEIQQSNEELQSQAEELRQSNEELEERTKELEHQQDEITQKNAALEQSQIEMKQAQNELEKKAHELEVASQYKSEFLANMSHELRTPLNSLLILAQLLSNNTEGNLTEKQVKYAKTLHSAGSDLLTLINEILDLSKIEAGKLEIHLEEVPLASLQEELEHKFQHVATKKGLAFHITVAEDLPNVLYTDELRLKQILNNLLSNAFKFTSEGEIHLRMQHPSNEKVSAMATKTIAISVADTGIGIPKDKQELIFQAFQQVDGSTSRRYGGTGLGLSISRELARALGGELQLDSEEGKGSTFTLYLPEILPKAPARLLDSQPKQAAISTEKGKPATEEIVDDREGLKPTDKSILIIEDDPLLSRILMEHARENNFKCLLAQDGMSGLQMAQAYQPNAIILDIYLPQIDGLTLMDRLKENPDTRHIPVHVISASDQSQELKKMGAIGYLQKPINMEQLGNAFQKIERFINKRVKTLLMLVDNEAQKLLNLVGGDETTVAVTVAEARELLKNTSFDCVIIDVDVEQKTGLKLLEQLDDNDSFHSPLIIYASRDLSESEQALLQRAAENITIKAVRSPERLLDEATLFLHQVEADLPKEKQQILRMVHDKEAILKNKKVLLVDDDIRNTFALMTLLEDKQLEIIVGNSGQEALDLLDKHPDIDIVLMDVMMPEMDGYEAMQRLRQQPRFSKLPIIAVTAKAMKGDKVKCLNAGASDYISKPLDTDKLLSLMRVWLYQ
ncbi:MAG: response regulator [Pseudomonadota bacterium]